MVFGFLESLGSGVMMVVWLVLALLILVFVHELGHFLAAKLFRMRVEKFSIGFPPKIWGKKWGETEYVVGATPLGGYVKISGMVDESMDTNFVNTVPEPWEFRSKPVWQRIIVITAGVIFNIILAIFIFTGLKYVYGEQYIPIENVAQFVVNENTIASEMGLQTGDEIVAINGVPVTKLTQALMIEISTLTADNTTMTIRRNGEELTLDTPPQFVSKLSNAQGNFGLTYKLYNILGEVSEDMPAYQAGLRDGDQIIQLNEVPIVYWEDMLEVVTESDGNPIEATWIRKSESQTDTLHASISPEKIGEGENARYIIGVYPQHGKVASLSFGESVMAGIEDTWINGYGTVLMFKKLLFGQENFREVIGGPLAIAKATKQAADVGMGAFWNMVGLLSVTLAIVNILPIPALDGGHLIFLIYEGIVRREPSLRVRMVAQQIGMFLMIALMIFVIINDALRF